jgi:hypothetical protein
MEEHCIEQKLPVQVYFLRLLEPVPQDVSVAEGVQPL